MPLGEEWAHQVVDPAAVQLKRVNLGIPHYPMGQLVLRV